MQDPNKKDDPMMAPPPYPGTTDAAGYNTGAAYGAGAPYPNQGFVQPPGAPVYPPQPGYPVQGGMPPPANPGYPPAANPGYPTAGGAPGMIRGGYDSDVEGAANNVGTAASFAGFSDKAVRRGFIRKVYGLLGVQLLITMAIIALFTFSPKVKLYSMRNPWLYWTAFGVMLTTMLAMVCCEGARRKAPTNYVFLGLFTLAEGFMLGTVTAHFDAESVFIAVGICAGVTLALTLFAFQTKYDFTTCGGMLCAMLVCLMIAGICVAIWPGKYAIIGYGVAGALIFSLYIVYDTQLMMGGSHKYSLDPEEYVFAALNLYLDIINLFMYILMIVGASKSD